jgi:hypothetical protein
MAGQALGLELEGLSQEDREFEATRQFIRFAGDAVKNALTASDQEVSGLGAAASARDALTKAFAIAKAVAAESARVHAPGLLRHGSPTTGQGTPGHSGSWMRKGKNIVIFGV